MRKFKKFKNAQEAIDFLTNFIAVANANLATLTTIDAGRITALTTLKTDLQTANNEAIAAEETREAKFTARDTKLDAAFTGALSAVNLILSLTTVPDALFDNLGLPAADVIPSSIPPITPTALAVLGFSDGTNRLTWNTAGNAPKTTYVIESRTGAGPWTYVDSTTRSKYDHVGQTPGVHIEYRIKAKRPAGESAYTGVVSVY